MLPTYELLARLGLAALLGSAIGFERERLSWTAGLRTHMLVCVGSCLVMVVSAFGFEDALKHPHVILDPSRVAAQVVSGIGFLGAGSILLRGDAVKGLTTAASVWAVAAVGLAVGGGLYVAAIASTVIMLTILAGLKPLAERLRWFHRPVELRMSADRDQVSKAQIDSALRRRSGALRTLVIRQVGEVEDEIVLTLAPLRPKTVSQLLDALRALPGVRSATLDLRAG